MQDRNRSNKLLAAILVFALVTAAAWAPAQDDGSQLTPEQTRKLTELLKANPTLDPNVPPPSDLAPPPATAKTPAKPAFTGNAEVAREAYANGDYETALKNYQDLATKGNGEASLIVGIMHQQGLGVKKDKAAAYAWYGRAAVQGESRAGEIVRGMNDNNELTAAEYADARARFRDISSKLEHPVSGEQADSEFQELQDDSQSKAHSYQRSSP